MHITVPELARACGVSVRHIYNLRQRNPDSCPQKDDVNGWRTYVAANRRMAEKIQHAPRSPVEVLSDHARYTKARADRTTYLAEADRLKVELVKRSVIPRIEVESEFCKIASRVRARLHRMCNDLPSALLGLSEAAIYKVVTEKMEHACRDLHLSDDFLEPRKGAK